MAQQKEENRTVLARIGQCTRTEAVTTSGEARLLPQEWVTDSCEPLPSRTQAALRSAEGKMTCKDTRPATAILATTKCLVVARSPALSVPTAHWQEDQAAAKEADWRPLARAVAPRQMV